MKDYQEIAIELWIDGFISDNDREPTDEEIEAAEYDAVCDYLAGRCDDAMDRMKDGY